MCFRGWRFRRLLGCWRYGTAQPDLCCRRSVRRAALTATPAAVCVLLLLISLWSSRTEDVTVWRSPAERVHRSLGHGRIRSLLLGHVPAAAAALPALSGDSRSAEDNVDKDKRKLQAPVLDNPTASITAAAKNLSPLCANYPGMCEPYVTLQRTVRRWRRFQEEWQRRWQNSLKQLQHKPSRCVDESGQQTGLKLPVVKIFWKGDDRITEVLGGSVMRTIMDSATARCPVRCAAVESEDEADISMVMLDTDARQWARNSSNVTCNSPRIIARIHLEGRNDGFAEKIYNMPEKYTPDLPDPGSTAFETSGSCALPSKVQSMMTDMLVSLYPESDVQLNYFFSVTDVMQCDIFEDNLPKCIVEYIRTKMPKIRSLTDFKYGPRRLPGQEAAQATGAPLAGIETEKRKAVRRWVPKETPTVLASVFVSVCTSSPGDQYRQKLVKELMTMIPTHSYGQCSHSHQLSERLELTRNGKKHLKGQAAKVHLAGLYPFLINFENSIEDHYRTEKMFVSLLTGSVPVLLGDPHVADALPPGSFIDAHKFANMSSLADYIKKVARSREEFAKFFKWREDVGAVERLFLKLHMNSLHALGRHSFFCRMCKVYREQFDPCTFAQPSSQGPTFHHDEKT